eukprot:403361891
MRRLAQLARFKKESNDIERGSLLFGSTYNQKASADFLKLLLIFIQKWATTLRLLNGKQTEISKIYQTLQKERVSIPSEEAVYSSLNFDSDNANRSLPQAQNKNNQQQNKQQFQSNRSPNINTNSNSQQLDYNKQQFQSQQQNNQQPRQQQQQNDKVPGQSRNDSLKQPQNSDRSQNMTPSPNLTREEQLQFQRQIKEDYKKLAEHHNEAKFAEELFQMGGDSGDQLDSQLLGDLRTQLTSAKQFSEDFLKRLMESPIQIKDSESKINKILMIIGEISTTLEKILIFKPYSPRSLKEIEKRRIDLEKESKLKLSQPQISTSRSKSSRRKDQEQDHINDITIDPQSQIAVNQSYSGNIRQPDSQNQEKVSQIKPQSQSRNVKEKLQQQQQSQQNDPLGFEKAQQNYNKQLEDPSAINQKIDEEIFKTNFAFKSDQFDQEKNQLNHDSWGTNLVAANAFNSQNNGFGDFEFKLIGSKVSQSFDPFNFPANNNHEPNKKVDNKLIVSPNDNPQIEMIKPQKQKEPPTKLSQQQLPQNDFNFDFNQQPIIQNKNQKEQIKVLEEVKVDQIELKAQIKQPLDNQSPNIKLNHPDLVNQTQVLDKSSPQMQQIVKKQNYDKLRSSSNQANLQLPSQIVIQKPQLSTKPVQKSDEMGMSMNQLQFTMTQNQMDFGFSKQQIKSFEESKNAFVSPEKQIKSNHNNRQMGVQMQQHAQLANINESPDADLSDEEINNIKSNFSEKDDFRFPSPSTNQKALRQSIVPNSLDLNVRSSMSNDFGFDFGSNINNSRQSIQPKAQIKKEKQQAQQKDPFNFEFQQPSPQQVKQQTPKEIQKRQSNKQIKVMEGLDNSKSPFSLENTMTQSYQRHDFKTASNMENNNKIINEDFNQFENEQFKSQLESSNQQKFDFNFEEPLNQTQTYQTPQQSIIHPSPLKNDQQSIDNHIIKQLNEQLSELQYQKDILQHHNEELKILLQGTSQKLKTQEEKHKQFDSEQQTTQQTINELQNEKIKQQSKINELEAQVKQYKKFEFLYEQEQFAKTELSNQLSDLQYKAEEYKKCADRFESHLQKKDVEIMNLKNELKKQEQSIIELQDQAEKDILNVKQSEDKTKQQLQKELFESKQREEDIKVEHFSQMKEFQKLDEIQNKKHSIEVQELKDQEFRLKNQLQNVQEQSNHREQTLLDQISQLQQQNEELKKKQLESSQQKLVIRPSAIKFIKEQTPQSDQKQVIQKSQRSQKNSNNELINDLAKQEENKISDFDFTTDHNEYQIINSQLKDIQMLESPTVLLNNQNLLFDDLIKTQSPNAHQIARDNLSILNSDTLKHINDDKQLEEFKVTMFDSVQVKKEDEDQLITSSMKRGGSVLSYDQNSHTSNQLNFHEEEKQDTKQFNIEVLDQSRRSDESDNDLKVLRSLDELDVREDLSSNSNHSDMNNIQEDSDSEDQMPAVPSSDSDREDPVNYKKQDKQYQVVDAQRYDQTQQRNQEMKPLVKNNPTFDDFEESNTLSNNLFQDDTIHLPVTPGRQTKVSPKVEQAPSTFDFNFPTESHEEQKIEITNSKPMTQERKQSQQNLPKSTFDFSFPDEVQNRMNTSPINSQNSSNKKQNSFRKSVIIESDTKSDIIKVPLDINARQQPAQVQAQDILKMKEEPQMFQQNWGQKSQISSKRSEEQNQNNQSISKKDSFLEMFGDILGGSTNNNNSEVNQNKPQEQQVPSVPILDLDDLLGGMNTTQTAQNTTSINTPNKSNLIQNQEGHGRRDSGTGMTQVTSQFAKQQSPEPNQFKPIVPNLNLQGISPNQNQSPINMFKNDYKPNQFDPLRQSTTTTYAQNKPDESNQISQQRFQTHNPQLINQQQPANNIDNKNIASNFNPNLNQQFNANQNLSQNPVTQQQFQTHNPNNPVNQLQQPPLHQLNASPNLGFQQHPNQMMFTPARYNPPSNNSPQVQQFGTPQTHQLQPSQFNTNNSSPNVQNISPDKKDIVLDKQQFSTVNTEQYAHQQNQQQQSQVQKLDPQGMIRNMLQQFFRKALVSNKSVVFENQNIQVGYLCAFEPTNGIARMRLFFANKNQNQSVTQLRLMQGPQQGFTMQQNRDLIPQITFGQQEPIDLIMKISSFQISIPIYQLAYQINMQQQQNVALRIPVVALKFCKGLQNLDAQGYMYKWNFECNQSHEFKQVFNVDFNQCRSMSQLKEILQFGEQNTITFVEGVEQQKNIVCGGTQFMLANGSTPLIGLVKVTISANGQGCEISGRSNDNEALVAGDPQKGKFIQHIINNILELISLQVTTNN